MTGNVNETAAESHQRLWGFSLGGGVDSHHLWFHFAAVSVTFPANGRSPDPASDAVSEGGMVYTIRQDELHHTRNPYVERCQIV